MRALDILLNKKSTTNVDFNKKYFYTFISNIITIKSFIDLYDSNEEFRKISQLAFLNAISKVKSHTWDLLSANYNNKIKIILTLVANDLGFTIVNPTEIYDFESKSKYYIGNVRVNTNDIPYSYDEIKSFTFNDDLMSVVEQLIRSDNDTSDDNSVDF